MNRVPTIKFIRLCVIQEFYVHLQIETNNKLNMQTTANYQDMSAVDALWTLYRQQPQQVREAFRSRIIEQEKSEEEHSDEQLKPYTLEEINAMLDKAEANFAAGKGIPDEEAWDEWKEDFARMRKKEPEIVEAV